MAGIVAEALQKIALNWAMIKIVPEQGRAGAVKLVMANINLALAIRAINTPAPALATPVVQVLLAAVNIPNVLVNHPILGHQGPVNALVLINTLVLVLVTPAVLVQPVGGSILNAIAQAIIFGMAAVVFSLAHQAINILVQELDMLEAPAPLAAENTPLALAPADMSGKTAPANSN